MGMDDQFSGEHRIFMDILRFWTALRRGWQRYKGVSRA